MKIYIVVTKIVNDVTYSRKSDNTRVVITLLLHGVKQEHHMILKYLLYKKDFKINKQQNFCLLLLENTYNILKSL